jgi:hypothetical protein
MQQAARTSLFTSLKSPETKLSENIREVQPFLRLGFFFCQASSEKVWDAARYSLDDLFIWFRRLHVFVRHAIIKFIIGII